MERVQFLFGWTKATFCEPLRVAKRPLRLFDKLNLTLYLNKARTENNTVHAPAIVK